MADPFIGEIRIFAGTFSPRDWAFCNGQLLQVADNTALFAVLGTTYGGDGRTTFGVPNLEGRAPMGAGNGPGLTSRRIGQSGGVTMVTLSANQMASHQHALVGTGDDDNETSPVGNYMGAGNSRYAAASGNLVSMSPVALPDIGGDSAGVTEAHNNLQPLSTLHFIIALIGLFPPRS